MFKNIVIPVDLEEKFSWKSVMPVASSYVKNMGSKLHFVHIIPDFGMQMVEDYLPTNWVKDRKKKCKQQLEHLVAKYLPKDIDFDFYIGRGAIYDEIISYANNVEADLIIVSAVGSQQKDYMLGPNASKIVRHADVSVLVIRG